MLTDIIDWLREQDVVDPTLLEWRSLDIAGGQPRLRRLSCDALLQKQLIDYNLKERSQFKSALANQIARFKLLTFSALEHIIFTNCQRSSHREHTKLHRISKPRR